MTTPVSTGGGFQPTSTPTAPERKFLQVGNQYFEIATFVDEKQTEATDEDCRVVAGKVRSTYMGLMERMRPADRIELQGTISSGSSLSQCDLTTQGIRNQQGIITTPGYVRPMPDDGNCLFHALVNQQLINSGSIQSDHEQLRKQAADKARVIREEKINIGFLKVELEEIKRSYDEKIRRNRLDKSDPFYKQLLDLLDREKRATPKEMMNWYQEYIRKDKNWGGVSVLDLFDEYMIEVYQMTPKGVKITYRTPHSSEEKRPLFTLWYNGRNHWDSINKDSPFFKEDRRKILEQELEEAQMQQAQEVARFEEQKVRQHVTTETGSQ